MNWRRGRNNSPPGTGGVARSAGVVDGSTNSPPHSFVGIKENHFDFTTTPALRATPPVPGGELVVLLLQFLHTFTDRSYMGRVSRCRIVHRIPVVQSPVLSPVRRCALWDMSSPTMCPALPFCSARL